MPQRLGRRIVRSDPEVIFQAEENCVLWVHVPLRSLNGETDNAPVVVQVNSAPAPAYGDERSAILPINQRFPIHLEAGDDLWAVSIGESVLSFSIIPEVAR
jgi:hypothetical protein